MPAVVPALPNWVIENPPRLSVTFDAVYVDAICSVGSQISCYFIFARGGDRIGEAGDLGD